MLLSLVPLHAMAGLIFAFNFSISGSLWPWATYVSVVCSYATERDSIVGTFRVHPDRTLFQDLLDNSIPVSSSPFFTLQKHLFLRT